MYTAKIQNAQGEILQINDQESKWAVLSITGLSPVPSQIAMSEIYGMDGAKTNSQKLTTRNIVILLRLCGEVENNRMELNGYFPQKRTIRFLYKTRSLDVYIDGVVETVEYDLHQQNELYQVSIICPDPYFRDVAETVVELENSQSGFEFPFSINLGEPVEFGTYESGRQTVVLNPTQNEIPFEIEITARKQLGSFTSFTIQNILTGEKIGFAGWPNDDGFMPGDVIRISTDPYHPTMTLQVGSTIYNRIGQMIQGGTFFTIHPGENRFAYKTSPEAGDADYIDIDLKFRNMYRGV